jgi:hypothetical protein
MLIDVGDSHKWTYLKNLEKQFHYLCIKHLVTQYHSPLVAYTVIKLFVENLLKFSKNKFQTTQKLWRKIEKLYKYSNLTWNIQTKVIFQQHMFKLPLYHITIFLPIFSYSTYSSQNGLYWKWNWIEVNPQLKHNNHLVDDALVCGGSL